MRFRRVASRPAAGTVALLALAVLAGAAPARLGAQDRCTVGSREESCSVEITVHRAPATVMLLVLSEPSVALASPVATRGAVLSQVTAGPVARVFANTAWQLQLSAAQPYWSLSGGRAASRKPATDLGWATRAAGPFTPLTLRPVTMAVGAATAGQAVPLYFQPRFDATTDAPGDYFLDIVLTLTAP